MTCVSCGYSLKGLPYGSCPECGVENAEHELRVCRHRAYLLQRGLKRVVVRFAWYIGIVAICIGALGARMTRDLGIGAIGWFLVYGAVAASVLGLPVLVAGLSGFVVARSCDSHSKGLLFSIWAQYLHVLLLPYLVLPLVIVIAYVVGSLFGVLACVVLWLFLIMATPSRWEIRWKSDLQYAFVTETEIRGVSFSSLARMIVLGQFLYVVLPTAALIRWSYW